MVADLSGPVAVTGVRKTLRVQAVGDFRALDEIAGALGGVGTASGGLSVVQEAAGAAEGEGAAAGGLTLSADLAGAGAGTSAATGTPTLVEPISRQTLVYAYPAPVLMSETQFRQIMLAATLLNERGEGYDFFVAP